MLGFRIDPTEKLKETAHQIQSLHQVYGNCPVFGVEFEIEELVSQPHAAYACGRSNIIFNSE